MTDANCEGFPICDDRISENDRCVKKIIGIHCMSLYTYKISIFSLPISHVKIGVKMSGFVRCAEAKLLFRFQGKCVCSYVL